MSFLEGTFGAFQRLDDLVPYLEAHLGVTFCGN